MFPNIFAISAYTINKKTNFNALRLTLYKERLTMQLATPMSIFFLIFLNKKKRKNRYYKT